jgi:hypothetical protein
VSYRFVAVERDGHWVAHAEQADSGRPFGIDCTGATEEQAIDRLRRWLEWQSEHAAALLALQAAERVHHRTVAAALANRTAEGSRRAKETLDALDAARVQLDRTRSRKPENDS